MKRKPSFGKRPSKPLRKPRVPDHLWVKSEYPGQPYSEGAEFINIEYLDASDPQRLRSTANYLNRLADWAAQKAKR